MTKKRKAVKGPRQRSRGRRARKPTPRGFVAGVRRLVMRFVIGASLLGGMAGVAASAWLYRGALGTVDQLLERPIWAESGRVASADVAVWSGMAVSSAEVAQVLQGIGYSRVPRVAQTGDVQVADDAILLRRETDEVLITFVDGVVNTVTPVDPVFLGPMELAGVRGPDAEARTPIDRSAVPQHLVEAVLAVEDVRFYEHEGVDPWGIGRAMVVNLLTGAKVQGGSTLTQQLAKNLFLTQERTYERKVRELALAVALEKRLGKDEILELYLSQVYLGQQGGLAICGVDQAARVFFGTSVSRIGIGQGATLAGIISAPNRYSPFRHPDRARERRDLALSRMHAVGWLGVDERDRAMGAPLVTVPLGAGRKAPWAVDAAIDEVEAQLGEGTIAGQAVSVRTTIQPLLQRIAERTVAEGISALEKAHTGAVGTQIALVAVDVRTGDILAMVGGRNYGSSGFNRVLHGRRQLGSTIKPLTWLMAFEHDPTLAPTTLIADEPIERVVPEGVWAPTNYDGTFEGEVMMGDALARSRNIPAVMVAEGVGMKRLAEGWRSLGLRGATEYPSAALGAFDASPVEIAGAFTVFPGEGIAAKPRLVRSVRLPDGEEGWADAVQRRRQTSARAAYLALQSLYQVMDSGTGRAAARAGLTGAVGGKTGTTDEGRDAWFVGFSGQISTAVWVGFDKGRALGLTGAQAALPTWIRFMKATGTAQVERPEPPDEVAEVVVCAETGGVAAIGCSETLRTWFSGEHAPDTTCALHGGEGGVFDTTRRIIDQIRNQFTKETPAPAERKWGLFKKRKKDGR